MTELSHDEVMPQFSSKETMLEEAIKHRDRLLQLLDVADARIRAIKSGTAVVVREVEVKEKPLRAVRANSSGTSLVGYIYMILKESPEPVHVNDVTRVVQEIGFETNSSEKVFKRSVNSALARDHRYKRVAPGTYALIGENNGNETEESEKEAKRLFD